MRTSGRQTAPFQTKDGLPDNFVRSLWEDRDGNLWAGTDGGLARLENGRFVSNPVATSRERDWVRCIYEDTEGNLWVGMNSGLNRFRDDHVHHVRRIRRSAERRTHHRLSGPARQNLDRASTIAAWCNLETESRVVYTTSDGLPSNEIFSIRENRDGDLLIATREGPSRMHDGHFVNPVIDDPLNRRVAFDFLEDRNGKIVGCLPGRA